MRKQELIHVHGLLAEVADHCADDLDMEFEDYQELGTRPTSINQSKTAHKNAVFTLAESVTQPLRATEIEAAAGTQSEASLS